jgi:RNA polymerase sigma-70 factor (ECF subfamily)
MDLESAVERLAPELLRFCTGLTRDPAEGEELAQEALVSLVRYWRAHGPPRSPAAFAYTVARRQAYRWQRRLRRFLPIDLLEPSPHPAPGPELSSMHRERLEETLRLLGKLSVHDREALLLAADPDMAVEEAAGVMGISPSAFKMRVHRARQRLSCLMETDHEFRKTGREDLRARA